MDAIWVQNQRTGCRVTRSQEESTPRAIRNEAQEIAPYRALLVVFRDSDRVWHHVDETGFNKIGYITQRGTVVHPRWNRGLTESPADRIRRLPHGLFQVALPSRAVEDRIEKFFTMNVSSIELFSCGITLLGRGDSLSFFDSPVRVPILEPISREEFEWRWAVFRSILQPADTIAVIDRESLVSRLIARIDHGTWSHVGGYSGDGTILEAIRQGVCERSIEVYHDPRYRIGVYRMRDLSSEAARRIVSNMRSQLGIAYSFRKLVRLAVLKLFGIRPRGNWHRNVSPNDIARSDNVRLTHIV